MQIPTGEPAIIQSLATEILEACTQAATAGGSSAEPGLPTLAQAFEQLLDVLSERFELRLPESTRFTCPGLDWPERH